MTGVGSRVLGLGLGFASQSPGLGLRVYRLWPRVSVLGPRVSDQWARTPRRPSRRLVEAVVHVRREGPPGSPLPDPDARRSTRDYCRTPSPSDRTLGSGPFFYVVSSRGFYLGSGAVDVPRKTPTPRRRGGSPRGAQGRVL